jgi:hypothetical protein
MAKEKEKKEKEKEKHNCTTQTRDLMQKANQL